MNSLNTIQNPLPTPTLFIVLAVKHMLKPTFSSDHHGFLPVQCLRQI